MRTDQCSGAVLDAHARCARIALIQSCWHRDIVDPCCESFMASMEARGIRGSSIARYEVPGAFEIPLQAKRLARSGDYDIMVAAGFVVDGGIYRHEFIAAAVIDALMSLQLDTLVPVISAVFTPKHFHDHDVHTQFFREHMRTKGDEAATACLAILGDLLAVQVADPARA